MIDKTSFLLILFFWNIAWAQDSRIVLTPEQNACLERIIYQNECASKPEFLVYWRADEDFPSLGIGHFIWYSASQKGPYQESFPALIQFLKQKGVTPPAWVEGGMPWDNREEFQKDQQSHRVMELRAFLEQTKALQLEFIVKRMENILPNMLEASRKEKRSEIEKKFYEVAEIPGGMFAMIDYVNFKGEGILLTERLQGHGWGLLQVLDEMKIPEKKGDALQEFVSAAERVLEKRVASSTELKRKKQLLRGWESRVQGYLKIIC